MRNRESDTDLCVSHEEGPNATAYLTNSFPIGIYVVDDSGYPELVGTGFFLRYRECLFLVTAFHLVKTLLQAKREFGVGCNFSINKVRFKGVLTNNNYAKYGKFDNTDIAAFCIRKEEPRYIEFCKCSVRHHQTIDGLYFEDGVAYCFLTGLPLSKNKISRTKVDSVGATIHQLVSFEYKIAHPDELHKIGKDPKSFIGLRWNKRKKGGSPVHPKGCSGAPVWFVKRRSLDMGIYLTGVFIEFHKREKLFVFTRIERLFELLEEHQDYWQELRRAET